MSKKIFREDFKQKQQTPVVEETIEEPVVEEVTEVVEEIAEPEPETVEGVVSGVNTALNIRRKPKVEPNNQIGIAGKGTKVIVVDPKHPVKNEGEEWYKVLFNKEPGYAMKKYIIVK